MHDVPLLIIYPVHGCAPLPIIDQYRAIRQFLRPIEAAFKAASTKPQP
jgi:hypothetical protein